MYVVWLGCDATTRPKFFVPCSAGRRQSCVTRNGLVAAIRRCKQKQVPVC